MTALIKYEAARAALAECRTVDEVKDIRDKAEAIRAYARMAQDTQLEADAAELRLRAERRLGIMLANMPRHPGGRPTETCSDEEQVLKLTDIGIDRKLSMRAQKVAGIAERAFEAAVERKRQDILRARGRVSLDITTEDKKERRAAREQILAGIQMALPERKFGVILADPEWRFEPFSRETGMDRAADNHYATSVTEAIAARPVGTIAADDCALFLWATVPMLPDALAVMAAWGFSYKSHAIWHKDRIGTGYWFRNRHELLLVGTRGNIPAPAMGEQWASVTDAPVGRHSAKPEIFHEMIEAYFPTLPKIELNRRGPPRRGWAAWGYEAEPVDGQGAPLIHDSTTGEIADGLDADAVSAGRCDRDRGDAGRTVPFDDHPARAGTARRDPAPDIEDIPKFLLVRNRGVPMAQCNDNAEVNGGEGVPFE